MPLFGKPWTAASPAPASGTKNHVLPLQKPLIWLGEGSVPEASLAQIRGGGIHKTDLVSLLVHEMVHAYLQIFAAQPEMAASGATEIEDFITESIAPRMRRLKTKKRQKFPCCISSEGGAAATGTASGREMMLRMGTAEGYLSDEPSMWTLETLRAIEAYWDAL
ncbi:hypothetical protein E8E14_010543 [Neopestalotiopsis sp. 37M]|nr:hypothetical protein E8E14_010543 [Neopestalotiopsis sp. 37M]